MKLSPWVVPYASSANPNHRKHHSQVPLPPAVDKYANPDSLSVSDTGLIAFDDDGTGGAVVFNSATGQFVDTGLPPVNNGHRQPQLSGDGRFLATTCDDTAATCVTPASGVDAYVQDLTTRTDTGFSQNGALDEQRPCIDGDGSLVGFDRGALGDHDVYVFDRHDDGTNASIQTGNGALVLDAKVGAGRIDVVRAQ